MNNDNNLELIDYGGFGCIYRPLLDCNLNNTGDKFHISKILKKNYIVTGLEKKLINIINTEKDILNYKFNLQPYIEYTIGKKISEKIPNFERNFYPALEYCNIKFRKMKKNKPKTIEKCKIIDDIINRDDKYFSFINYKIKYIDNPISLLQFFSSNIISQKKIQNALLYNTDKLLNSLQILRENNIVHNDLKYNNIIMNLTTMQPYIIDFGISIDMDLPYIKNPILFMKNITHKIYGDTYDFNSTKTLYNYANLLLTHFYINVPEQTYHVWDVYRHFICYLLKNLQNSYIGGNKISKNIVVEEFSLDESKIIDRKSSSFVDNMINFPNPYNNEFNAIIEPIITKIVEDNLFIQSIYPDTNKYINESINAIKLCMCSISKEKIEYLDNTHIIKMIDALIKHTWTTWDTFTFCLYNYNIIKTNMKDSIYKEKLLSKMYTGIQPDYNNRFTEPIEYKL